MAGHGPGVWAGSGVTRTKPSRTLFICAVSCVAVATLSLSLPSPCHYPLPVATLSLSLPSPCHSPLPVATLSLSLPSPCRYPLPVATLSLSLPSPSLWCRRPLLVAIAHTASSTDRVVDMRGGVRRSCRRPPLCWS
jgi:hypothetical protein